MPKHTGTTSSCTTKTLDGNKTLKEYTLSSHVKTHSIEPILKDPALDLALDTIRIGKQALVFVNTKRSAEASAEKIAKKQPLSPRGEALAKALLDAVSSPTKQCERLAFCARKEIAFHHSGLTSKQRTLIEDAFREGTIQVIAATPTLCLSGATRIWTGMEETVISELGRKELTVLKESSTVKIVNQDVITHVHDAEMISITSASGRTITTTPHHEFLIKRKGKKQLVQAQEITLEDKIATIGHLHVQERPINIPDVVSTYTAPNVRVDEDIAYFIGAMLGDGYSGGTIVHGKFVPKTTPCLVGKDSEVRTHTKLLLDRLGLPYWERVSTQGIPQLFLSKKRWFVEFMTRCGVLQSTEKHVAPQLLYLPKDQVAALLRGYFDADGYVSKRKSIGVSSISLQLIRDVQKLLLRFGIPTRFRTRKKSTLNITGAQHNTKQHYELTIATKEGINRFCHAIGFSIERKQRSLRRLIHQQKQPSRISCTSCEYKLSTNIFSGRTAQQKTWGAQKRLVIQSLGMNGEQGSQQLTRQLGFVPRKKELRTNAHYELIQKRRRKNSNTEWYWSLNTLGEWIFRHRNHQPIQHLLFHKHCPLCGNTVEFEERGNWRKNDFEGDIYWDVVCEVAQAPKERVVYDVVLPQQPQNDHLFVAEGFFTHNSAGVDTPAFRSIIRDYKRFTGAGMQDIPVLEYHQMAGRAGRPDYGDDYGEAILVAKHEAEADMLTEKYLYGEPEAIYSKVSAQPVLRTYTLSLIASEYVKTYEELVSFFSETFFAHQYQDLKAITHKLATTVEQLREWGFLENTGVDEFASADQLVIDEVRATPLGKRVSELYIDPLSAHKILVGLTKSKSTLYNYLHLLCSTQEMRPLLRIKPDDYEVLEEHLAGQETMLVTPPSIYDSDYESHLEAAKTARLLSDWADERSEEYLLETYNARPGEVRARVHIADWLLYAAAELSRIVKRHQHIAELQKARTRLTYGAREELLPMLRLKNVGRVRARKLYRNGVRTAGDLKKIDAGVLSELLGPTIAKDLKKQVGIDVDEQALSPRKRTGQLSLDAKRFTK